MGISSLLCDIGQSLEIVCEHTLRKNINEYKMIVVPETFYGLERETIDSLLLYAKNGGSLVLTGKNTCLSFSRAGAPFVCKEHMEYLDTAVGNQQNGHNNISTNKYKPYCFTMNNSSYGAMFSPCEIVADNASPNAFFAEKPTDKSAVLSATVPYGSGKITVIGFDIGSQYLNGTQYMHRELMKQIASSLYEPIVEVKSALGRLEIVVLNKDGKLMLQLVNAGGAHADNNSATDDYIPPVLDIELSISLPSAPKRLILRPEGVDLPFTYNDGKASVRISRVDIHSIIEICE